MKLRLNDIQIAFLEGSFREGECSLNFIGCRLEPLQFGVQRLIGVCGDRGAEGTYKQ